ncbi:hypothetical protein [Enterobacillus tribolii]|uniref:hypothetical protein n=1 Tax=Enterobacillus tribolii TaxID=1487935 RepID=UPI000E1D8102|nr:hypothetical protein [Enterobacillus tribolii]MBW7981805.1 hypothetical protein [Enterobacillus tribolii]
MQVEKGRELISVIEKLGEIEWQRCHSRYPVFRFKDQKEFTEDRSTRPPATSFRFKNEDPQIINLLQHAINSYKGKLQWIMDSQKKEYGSGINRVIYPKHVHDMKHKAIQIYKMPVEKYMALYEPEFGPIAYDDLVDLTKHVIFTLRNSGIDI